MAQPHDLPGNATRRLHNFAPRRRIRKAECAGGGQQKSVPQRECFCPHSSQVLTDRFNLPGSSAPCNNLGNYCGGTFQGIIDQLDYIQVREGSRPVLVLHPSTFWIFRALPVTHFFRLLLLQSMGFDAVWISPIVTNAPGGEKRNRLLAHAFTRLRPCSPALSFCI